jgi:Ca2+/H+ antiporter
MNRISTKLKSFIAIAMVCVFTVGMQAQTQTPAPLFFPNPAYDVLTVKAESMKQIEVIDMSGRIVIKKECSAETERLEIANLKEGLYFLRVTMNDNKVTVVKFVKK